MKTEMQPYIVYILPDVKNRITSVNSSSSLASTDGWRAVDSGFGDKYHHAQSAYFPLCLHDERGIWRYTTQPVTDDPDREVYRVYEYEGEQWGIYERTAEEMDADYIPPVPQPDPTQRIADLEAAIAAIEEGIASV